MRVFVTGHKGYIGSHLVELLKKKGHQVTGCDLNLFGGCEWEPLTKPDAEIIKDVRKVTAADIEDHDCIIHLAAISNDPMGALNPELTYSINRDASIRLAMLAKSAGISRYLFAGSCSIYGKGKDMDLDERAKYHPLSAYAESKVQAEAAISKMADETFSPAFLRNATAYGHSAMLRIDLVVNNLLACAHTKGQIRVMSDGSPWRPLVHCRDIARAFCAFLEAPRETIHNQAVNIGGDRENYQVKDVADMVQTLLPDSEIVFTGEVGADPRNYRVKFAKLAEVLPDFRLAYTLELGMTELYERLKEHGFSLSDFDGDQFVRLRAIEKSAHLLNTDQHQEA